MPNFNLIHRLPRAVRVAAPLLILLTLGSGSASADEPEAQVARLSYLKGDVEVLMLEGREASESERDWHDATLNRPLIAGDRVSTDGDARAELQLGSGNIQLEEETELGLTRLDDERVQIELSQGSIHVQIRRGSDQRFEIITDNAKVALKQPGSYRITRWDDDVTQLQVRRGQAEVTSLRQQYPVAAGEQLTLSGKNRLSAVYDKVPAADDFDRWAAERNERDDRQAARYVADDVIGYDDLDDYGDWISSEYGYVWRPARVAVDWAPYRYGRWTWVSPWGWTWIDDAPWGFAPFHYGRWTRIHDRWCWVPGPRQQRAVYAPALVAWIGTPTLSIRVGVDSRIGWLPLAPHEVYRPPFRSSERYVRQVNLSNGRFDPATFDRELHREPRQQDYRNHESVIVLNGRDFGSGRPIDRHLAPDRRNDWSNQNDHRTPNRDAAPIDNRRPRPIETDRDDAVFRQQRDTRRESSTPERWPDAWSRRDDNTAVRVEPDRRLSSPLPTPSLPPVNAEPRQNLPRPDLTPRPPINPGNDGERRQRDPDGGNDWRGARGPWSQRNDDRGVVPINPGPGNPGAGSSASDSSRSAPPNGGNGGGNNERGHDQRGHGRFGPEAMR